MPDSKITALTSTGTGTDPAVDPLVIVDVSDTTMAATGTTKKVTLNQLLACSPTATLASATITGDLTVDTSTLKVDSANNRVGILTASPAYPLSVAGRISYSGAIGEGADTTVSSSGTSLLFGNSSTWSDTQFFAGGNLQYRVQSAGVFTWYDGAGGTRMTLNSTGLGVGASPSYRLHVSQSQVGETNIFVDNQQNDPAALSGLWLSAYGGTWKISVPRSATFVNPLIFKFGSTEMMRITSDGNVGIGVTPTYKLQSVGIAAATSSTVNGSGGNLIGALLNSDDANSGVNPGVDLRRWTGTALNHGLTYIATNATGDTLFYNGTAASNTRATSLKMTLDASGNLLVGKTTGVNKLETVGAGVDGRGTVTGVSTVATTIYTIKQSATAAMCVVFGDNGTDGFCDIVLFLATVAPKVVSSQTLYGSPAARTYSASTTNLQLALASGTLSIRTAALSTLNT